VDSFTRRLTRAYGRYTLGFVLFVVALAYLERRGMPKTWIGFCFLAATVGVYAVIGVLSRTTDTEEYFVAGRRVPAVFNGMAAGADWMSAATFLGLAGTLYLSGFGGLAYVLGWTGGFCLVALLLAPYLRKSNGYTLPDFLGTRYGSTTVRVAAALAAVLVSFVYLVAQIYGIGLITTRLTGMNFELGVFIGLGGVLVCSFLGGMRAVTWTQVAQYIIIIAAYIVPVAWLGLQQSGTAVPQAVYGHQLQALGQREAQLLKDPAELQVRAVYAERARQLALKLADVPDALAAERAAAAREVNKLKAAGASLADVQAAEKRRAALPRTEAEARERWQRQKAQDEVSAQPLAGMPVHAQAFAGDPHGTAEDRRQFDDSRRNFLALAFCLMVGTAGLPHILTRYYTTPTVSEARRSVAWTLFFIGLLYLTAPALAVMVKTEVFNHLVGTRIDELPAWITQWSRVDPSLLTVDDINRDGILQLGELRLGGDLVMLVTPELSGLPFVISGMVAAGGLAAALSTADGLLLTISAALSHDIYFRSVRPAVPSTRRVTLSKALLLATAIAAAAVATQKPADILFLVGAAFSIAGAVFFPALVLGIFWRRANAAGALAGMITGLVVTLGYMSGATGLWWGIQPLSAGFFGAPVALLAHVLVSLLTPAPSAAQGRWLDDIRRA